MTSPVLINVAIAAILAQRTRLCSYRRYTQRFLTADPGFDFSKPRTLYPKRPAEEWLQWRPGYVSAITTKGKTAIVRHDLSGDGTDQELLGPVPISENWIYAFVLSEARDEVSFLLEMWVDEKGAVHVNPIRDKDRKHEWPKPVAGSRGQAEGRIHELPRRVLGRGQFYWMIGTPFRLTAAAVRRFERADGLLKIAPPIDLRPDHITPSEDGVTDLPVLLPLFVARQLHSDFETAVRQRIKFMGGTVEGTNPSRMEKPSRKERNNVKRYFLSKAIAGLMADEDLADTIEDDFRRGRAGFEKVQKFIRKHEAEQARLAAEAEARAADLCRWMDRKLFHIVTEGCEREDESILLEHYNECTNALPETPIGVAHVTRLLDRVRNDPGHFLTRYAVVPEPPDPGTLDNALKAPASVLNIVQTVHLSLLAGYKLSVNEVLQSLTNVLGAIVVVDAKAWTVRTATLRQFAVMFAKVPKGEPPHPLEVRVRVLVAKGEGIEALTGWVNNSEHAMRFLDMMNAGMLMRAYLDTPEVQEQLKFKRGLDALAEVGLVAAGLLEKAFRVAERDVPLGELVARMWVRSIGVTFAMVSALVTVIEGHEALERGDYDAAVAAGASAVVAFISMPFAIAAGAPAFAFLGPLVWVMAAISAAFYVLYLLLKDEPMETFIAHCFYGRRYTLDSARPRWSPTRLSEWKGNWDHQIAAFHSLATAFAIGFGERMWYDDVNGLLQPSPHHRARIYVGVVDESTEFHLTWTWRATKGSGTQDQLWVAAEDAGDSTAVVLREPLRVDADGRVYFDAPIPDGALRDTSFSAAFARLSVSVRKTFRTAGKRIELPLDGPLAFLLYDGRSLRSTGNIVSSLVDEDT